MSATPCDYAFKSKIKETLFNDIGAGSACVDVGCMPIVFKKLYGLFGALRYKLMEVPKGPIYVKKYVFFHKS